MEDKKNNPIISVELLGSKSTEPLPGIESIGLKVTTKIQGSGKEIAYILTALGGALKETEVPKELVVKAILAGYAGKNGTACMDISEEPDLFTGAVASFMFKEFLKEILEDEENKKKNA